MHEILEHRQKAAIKGRGTSSSLPGRFAVSVVELDETGEPLRHPDTQLRLETARSLITRNQSPDVPFRLSVNPYRGCEQGCVYCFARPSHAYLDLSPGLEFETRISAKQNAPDIFEQELRKRSYRCEPIALGINTDAYQPVEKELQITRQLLEIALNFQQPVSIVTKSALILRDRDLLSALAERHLVHVAISVTTLDNALKRILEPRAASPAARLKVIRELRQAGVPVSVLLAPVIPLINEHEIESILTEVAEAGAQAASYILLRLPHEVAPLFVEWLHQHFPERAGHVINRLTALHGGRLYDSRFGQRMRGQGIFAELIEQRFHIARRRNTLSHQRLPALNTAAFSPPPLKGDQLSLW